MKIGTCTSQCQNYSREHTRIQCFLAFCAQHQPYTLWPINKSVLSHTYILSKTSKHGPLELLYCQCSHGVREEWGGATHQYCVMLTGWYCWLITCPLQWGISLGIKGGASIKHLRWWGRSWKWEGMMLWLPWLQRHGYGVNWFRCESGRWMASVVKQTYWIFSIHALCREAVCLYKNQKDIKSCRVLFSLISLII